MGGGTVNIRTSRGTSSCNGYKTLGSMLASDSSSGAGSVRRMYGYYTNKGLMPSGVYKNVFNINYGQYKNS